jgi:hypothetical protein
MLKADLLADIETKVLKVVAVVEEADAVKNAAGVRQYIANVLEQNGERVASRNIGFYVQDEGEATEEAYYRDVIVPKSVARTLVENYLEGLRPATFLWYKIHDVDEVQRVARATVITADTFTEKNIVVYKIGSNPTAHAELTTL